jgi:uncharacterized protein YndB with AHSA1/START domain
MREPIHHAIDIDADSAQVWRVFTDLSTWPRWFPNAVGARALREDPFRRGGAVEVDLELPVVGSIVLRLDVEEADPQHKVRWIGKAWGVRGDHSYTFEDRRQGAKAWTRVTSHELFDGPLSILATGLARDKIDRLAHEALAHFKTVVEERIASV